MAVVQHLQCNLCCTNFINKDWAEENRACLLSPSRVYQSAPAVTCNKGHMQDLQASSPLGYSTKTAYKG